MITYVCVGGAGGLKESVLKDDALKGGGRKDGGFDVLLSTLAARGSRSVSCEVRAPPLHNGNATVKTRQTNK
eukprot:1018208-Pyramimonas_sp.AAC.1